MYVARKKSFPFLLKNEKFQRLFFFGFQQLTNYENRQVRE